MAADPPTNDAAWNNASYCLYPNGNGISAGRWPPDCWPTYDKKGKCSNQDRECDVAEDCNRKAWWRAKYGIGECLAPHFDVDLAFYLRTAPTGAAPPPEGPSGHRQWQIAARARAHS